MECPVCMDVYDEAPKIPRNLQCGHTICEECINIVFRKKKGGIVCPICNFAHDPKIMACDLSKNYVAAEIAQKHRKLKKKLMFCREHKEPEQFYCEDDSTYFCIECIVYHSGHHFVKQECSVPLLHQKIERTLGLLQERSSETEDLRTYHERVRVQLKTQKNQEVAKLDAEFDRLVALLNARREMLKGEIEDHFHKENEGILEDEKKLIKYEERLAEGGLKLKEMEAKLQAIKVIKSNEQLREFEDCLQNAEEALKCELRFGQKEAELSSVSFGKDISSLLQQYGSYKVLVRPKICFFGERRKLLFYDIEKQNWFCISLPGSGSFTPELNYYSAAASYPSGKILITGGGASNAVYLVTIGEKTIIQQRKPMLYCRKEHSCVYLAGFVFVISGYDGKNKAMNYSCEKYDVTKNEWSKTGDINRPRCAFAAASVGEQFIYVFGGFDGHQRMKSIECYDIKTGVWTIIATELKQSLSNSAAIALSPTEIIVLGGGYNQGFSYEVLRFNTVSKEFTDMAKMNEGRDLRNKLVKYRGQLYAIGGNFFNGEKMNLRTGKWEAMPQYGSFVLDNLDSWCCALSYECDSRCPEPRSQDNFPEEDDQ